MNILLKLTVIWALCGVTFGHPNTSSEGVIKIGNCADRMTAFPPDPKTECCGHDADPSRLQHGFQTEIDQHPWLALIEYEKRGALETLCNGALISGKYILTTAHCITGPSIKLVKPVSIRLGEYDTNNEGQDCVVTEFGGKDCTEGAVRIPIEKIIPHPEYNFSDKRHENDIALIRMAQVAPYTDFIRPICLPTEALRLNSNDIVLNKASWGTTDRTQNKLSSTKLQVTLPLVSQDRCQSSYSDFNITLSKGQLCAGGHDNQDFCKGDGGAPLVYDNGRSRQAVGLVSFGPKGCMGKIPIVYTNVYEYNDWIKSNIVA